VEVWPAASVVEATERMSPLPPPLNLPITLATFIYHYVLSPSSKAWVDKSSVGYFFKHPEPTEQDELDLVLATKLKSRVARRLLLALKRKEEEGEAASVEGRIELVHDDLRDLYENVNLISMKIGANRRAIEAVKADTRASTAAA
jgi:hypothetical protein